MRITRDPLQMLAHTIQGFIVRGESPDAETLTRWRKLVLLAMEGELFVITDKGREMLAGGK